MSNKLTIERVAERYHRSKATVGRWIKDNYMAGFPRPTDFGGFLLWDEEELEKWEKSLPRKGAPPDRMYIYVVEALGRVKVGISGNPTERLITLQNEMGFRFPHLKLVYIKKICQAPAVEGIVKGILAPKRITGEQFNATPTEAISIIEFAISEIETVEYTTHKALRYPAAREIKLRYQTKTMVNAPALQQIDPETEALLGRLR